MGLFQRGHFLRSVILIFFLLCQLNTKLQNSHPNAMSQNRLHNISM